MVTIKIGIGNDHRGLKLKNKIVKYLYKKGYKIFNYGTNDQTSVDYPDYAKAVGTGVANSEIDLGILICGTGIGMSIACNKVKGARCARVLSTKDAKLAKEHNNANVLAFGEDLPFYKVKDILDVFLKTNFSSDERHLIRVDKIER